MVESQMLLAAGLLFGPQLQAAGLLADADTFSLSHRVKVAEKNWQYPPNIHLKPSKSRSAHSHNYFSHLLQRD
jgi:hypothetical protein